MSKIPKVFYDMHKRKCHVISSVEDGQETIILFKWWGKRNKRWFYKAITKDMLEFEIDLIERHQTKDCEGV